MEASIMRTLVLIWLTLSGARCDFFPTQCECVSPGLGCEHEAPTATFDKGVVVTDDEECSEMARDILNEHGNACDAAITAMLCVGLKRPESMGIGGGFLATWYKPPISGQPPTVKSLNSREVAPHLAMEDMFDDGTSSTVGGKSVAVPMEAQGYGALYQECGGDSTWAELFQPVIDLCWNGFLISKYLGWIIEARESYIRADPVLSDIYLHNDGTLYQAGENFVNHRLCLTLERISANGHEHPLGEPYGSSLAKDMVNDIKDNDGIIIPSDFFDNQPRWTDAVCSTVNNKNLKICGPKPPSSSSILQLMLKILDGYNFDKLSKINLNGETLTVHRTIEAMKFGFAKRTSLGDPKFVDGIDELVEQFVSDEFANEIREKINDDGPLELEAYDPHFSGVEDGGTSQISILSPTGEAFSATSTINTFMGARFAGQRTGIIFNDEMDDFAKTQPDTFGIAPSPNNRIEPGKNPMSSMSPLLVFDEETGEVVSGLGGAGGPRIISGVLLHLINEHWFEMKPEEAMEEPRFHHQLLPARVEIDNDFSQAVMDKLISEKNYDLSEFWSGFKLRACFKGRQLAISTVNSFSRESGGPVTGVADYRRDIGPGPAGIN